MPDVYIIAGCIKEDILKDSGTLAGMKWKLMTGIFMTTQAAGMNS